MKKFLTKENITIGIIFIILSIIFIFTMIGYTNDIKCRYNECINNPPDISYVEKYLEDKFITTNVEVIKMEQEKDTCYYIVKANGLYFKVVYCICTDDYGLGVKEWRYQRYIQISESEVNEQISQ